MKRGYTGIGVYHPKTEENIGTLWRSAHAFGADFIFTVGRRYKPQASDTAKSWKHLPLFEFNSLEHLSNERPRGSQIVCVELRRDARELRTIQHPEQALYLLGAEDYGLPEEFMKGKPVIQIGGLHHCLNVAVAGSLVLYDRFSKLNHG